MKHINKKYILLSTILFSALLAGCNSNRSVNLESNTGTQVAISNMTDIGDDTLNINSALVISGTESTKYLSGYRGDTVVITSENSGAIVEQQGDALLYRNEIYGFQVLLGKEWKGGRICIVTGKGLGDSAALIRFAIKHPVKSVPSLDTTGCIGNPLFESHIQLNIYTNKDYMAYKSKPLEPGSKETPRSMIQKQTYGNNNTYYITLTQNVPDNRIQQLYPYIACKTLGKSGDYDIVNCPGRINQLFTNGLSTFNN